MLGREKRLSVGRVDTKSNMKSLHETSGWTEIVGRQILSDAWGIVGLGKFVSQPFAYSDRGNKIGIRRSAKNVGRGTFGNLSVENSTSCMRILKFTDTCEVVPDTRCLLCMEKRQNHVRMNSERESKGLLREPWQERPGWRELCQEKPRWIHTRTESLGENESERGEQLEFSKVHGMCLRNLGIKNGEQVADRHADASGGYIIENQHEEKK